jgi:hypothetical protein
VSDEKKTHVRYMVENNKQGQIGIRIDPFGNCQILALSNIKLLPAVDTKIVDNKNTTSQVTSVAA